MGTFTDFISEYVSLSTEEIEFISSKVDVKDYKAGHLLLQAGQYSNLAYFNIRGCVRLYYLVDGDEKTTFFYTENQFITSIRSFNENVSANHYLECIEDCTLVLMTHQAEEEILKKYPKLEAFARVSMQQELANYQDMLSSYIISNPEERYLNLLKNTPNLLQRVPLYQLATYLGITPESLSRIRKRISKKTS